ncbi:Upstream activation factor subunit spp27 [Porphyridium purpureum]|uniref:Upstream activation factor subunit spp27 n=1 Tax=Porphyridium purpureum TaxID=35688 RepID=A0A5J4YSR2_PORPP|nr:Upstream activation factor subunit spp27 [Porphyridium purpureum]|eukprot:POR1365..scf227_4
MGVAFRHSLVIPREKRVFIAVRPFLVWSILMMSERRGRRTNRKRGFWVWFWVWFLFFLFWFFRFRAASRREQKIKKEGGAAFGVEVKLCAKEGEGVGWMGGVREEGKGMYAFGIAHGTGWIEAAPRGTGNEGGRAGAARRRAEIGPRRASRMAALRARASVVMGAWAQVARPGGRASGSYLFGALAAPRASDAGARAFHASATVMRAEKVYLVDDRLAKLAGIERVATRSASIKAISNYAKAKGLQDPANRREFTCNAELKSLLGADRMMFLQINKYVTPLLHDVETHGNPAQKKQAELLRASMESQKAAAEPDAKGKKPAKKKRDTSALEKAKAEKTGIYQEYKLSAELKDLCGTTVMSRPEVVKALWTYAKNHKLQDGRMIKPDAKLAKITGSKETIDGFKMTSLLKPHLLKL